MIVEPRAHRVRLRIGDRTITIAGDSTPDGPDGPDFVIHLDTIEAWDPPHENDPLSLDDDRRATHAAEVGFAARRMAVEFE